MLMTQAAVNNAKVLYQLSVERAVVEKTDALIFLTPELLEVLENHRTCMCAGRDPADHGQFPENDEPSGKLRYDASDL